MVILLWGVIISKCLTLEYLIQVYSIPVNSFFYIWSLTLGMAVVATIAFLRTKNVQIRNPARVSVVHVSWFGCFAASLLAIGCCVLLDELRMNHFMALLAIILGIGYLVHGITLKESDCMLNGIGWWIGAAVLVTRDEPDSLSTLAFLVILLTVLPIIIRMRKRRIGFL